MSALDQAKLGCCEASVAFGVFSENLIVLGCINPPLADWLIEKKVPGSWRGIDSAVLAACVAHTAPSTSRAIITGKQRRLSVQIDLGRFAPMLTISPPFSLLKIPFRVCSSSLA
jgi:hypothetical protein